MAKRQDLLPYKSPQSFNNISGPILNTLDLDTYFQGTFVQFQET